ncbi:LOW QUALITY PROTEIN: hypothetical protein PNEG_04302 [Pneumocystis murina B123]|uniref:DUF4536 domain-containing protein n=1 Tax=Pneumocystis murina (strain B123) TaxID=1069680 RepID=A0A0W4ZWZ5_PNEMU|nr:LOW QUALITY PROTEIN: hypothetical protein PNEG_04302 [Pneumocystis murina B123]KTW32898.1 LOW QUALITY PROTEIN: hypothetical protein PNEG_04302 [Pneumocystis murina B123]
MTEKNTGEILEKNQCFSCKLTSILTFGILGIYILYQGRKKYRHCKLFIKSGCFQNLNLLLKKKKIQICSFVSWDIRN